MRHCERKGGKVAAAAAVLLCNQSQSFVVPTALTAAPRSRSSVGVRRHGGRSSSSSSSRTRSSLLGRGVQPHSVAQGWRQLALPRQGPATVAHAGADPKGLPPDSLDLKEAVDKDLVRVLLLGEVLVLAAAVVLAANLNIKLVQDTLQGLSETQDVLVGLAGGVPPFLASAVLEASRVGFFKEIDQDTRLYVLRVFGYGQTFPRLLAPALGLAVVAGVCEETFFRGVLLHALLPVVGPLLALVLSSLAFGFAHTPVPGASAYVEVVYGAVFGLVYLSTGGNLAAAMAAHVCFDLLTFLEVHYRASSRLSDSLALLQERVERDSAPAPLPSRVEVNKRLRDMDRAFRLKPGFFDMARAVFEQLDMDGNGGIDMRELQLGIRTFGAFMPGDDVVALMGRADLDRNGQIDLSEFVRLLIINAKDVEAQKLE